MIPTSWSYSFASKSGLKMRGYIGPYVWMYHQGKIDAIIVEDENGCEVRPKCAFDMETSSPQELAQFLNNLELPESKCLTCGATMLAHAGPYRTNDECDKCAKVRIAAEYQHEMKKVEIQEAAEEKLMHKKGYRWKILAWVHPTSGDDYQISAYTTVKPSQFEVAALLKKKKSTILTDYELKELTK